ncbi:MAG: hypothetical protein AB8B58_15275 [Roseobacter sp.]
MPHKVLRPLQQMRRPPEWTWQGTTAEAVNDQSHSESLVLVWDGTGGDATEPNLFIMPDPDDPERM